MPRFKKIGEVLKIIVSRKRNNKLNFRIWYKKNIQKLNYYEKLGVAQHLSFMFLDERKYQLKKKDTILDKESKLFKK